MTMGAARRFDVLLTAKEAYPALEGEFMSAKHDIIAGFRVFDPWTTLRSDQARQIGETWFDLIIATLNRGVQIEMILSDFDPVVRPSMHTYAWECLRGLIAAGEASNHPERLRVRTSMHPARVGILPRLALWARSTREIRNNLIAVNQLSPLDKQDYLDRAPGLKPMVKWRGQDLIPRLRPPALIPVTHHQKLAVFDGETLYAGGLDLNDRRYDTPDHNRAAKDTWHDTQVLVDGPIAREAATHLRSFEAVTYGTRPQPMRHLLRTISARRKLPWLPLSPKASVNELATEHAVQIAQSERLIYLESQFFRDKTLARQLARRARENPDLTLILILPAAPEEIAFDQSPGPDAAFGEHLQVASIEIIQKAFGPRLFIGAPAQPRAAEPDGRATHFDAPIVYLHAKVSIFDDRSAIVSSANLNGRSLSWDTEVGVQTDTQAEVDHLKTRCFTHWLGTDARPEFFEADTACAAWSNRARQNASLPPEQRTGFLLPYLTSPARNMGYNLPGVPDEMA
ncbi:phospholipase D-like domain-containing protein [uncultured Tateyamaria sp.]|uniref:phospholipase D-like domain-containing protein n=1 Tax=uncultured Tateyamaria sp. TaxID=455651 RepID=UPI0026320FC2|nr:phospholipase D-like domain-containing protein [uncultured Tateyamaria sp.]